MRQILFDKRFAGIADSDKEGLTSQYYFARSVDYRSDPTKLTILPATSKSSSTTAVDLPMWGERYSTDLYCYGNAGHLYKKTSGDVWSDERTVASSSGNGLKYFGEDDYLYYTSDKVIGRLGPMSGTAAYADDFLGSEGGVPQNTHSLVLGRADSKYASAADHSSLSITGDLSLETYVKPTSLTFSGTDPNTHSLDLEYSSSQYASVADNANLSITSDMTIECWVKFESSSTEQVFVSKYNDVVSSQRSYYFYYAVADDKLALTVSNNVTFTTAQSNTFSPQTGVWYHLAVVYDASAGTAYFYKNGVAFGSGTGLVTSIYDNNTSFAIGARNIDGTATDFFDGKIDDVRLWNTARTADQIKSNMARELASGESGLAGYWKLNNDYTDSSGNSSNLTASGSPVFSTDTGFSGQTMALLSKWNESGATRSYLLDVVEHANGYMLRFAVSSNGNNFEYFASDITTYFVQDVWHRWAVTWDASASTAYFYRDGTLFDTIVGSLTAIHDNASTLLLGANTNSAGSAANFFDGKIDDYRIWNDIRTTAELLQYNDIVAPGSSANLQAYWKVDNSTDDASDNTNTLTLQNSPAYDATDVPFSSPGARRDEDQSNSDSGQTYSLTTAIDETATHRQSFVPAKDPQKSIQINIAAKGSGNWTLTIHDALNRVIASKTVANADLNNGDYEFVFASVWRPVIGATYHFHLTTTVADGTATTGTASDLEDADFVSYYQFLVEDVFHPIFPVLNKIAIGNERYLATWDGITYTPHKLTFPSGYRVRCLGEWREYLAIGVTRGPAITSEDSGKIFFWDGSSTTYNFYISVPQGGINAILSGDPLIFVAGYSGILMTYSGGRPKRLLRFPKMTNSTTMEVYPGGIAMWRALTHIGVAGDSDSTVLEKGVYAYGTLNERQDETLSYDYPISTGTRTGTGLDIGMVFTMGTSLYIGWKDGSDYGVDVVKLSNSPFTTATYESLIKDANKLWNQKEAFTLRAYFKSLVSGDSFTLKYKTNRNSSWTSGSAVSTAGKTEGRLNIPSKSNKFDEFQWAVDFATSNSSSPELYSMSADVDDRREEKRV